MEPKDSRATSTTKLYEIKADKNTDDHKNAEEFCLELLKATASGESSLHLAIVNGDLPAVKYLIAEGADVNSRVNENLFVSDNPHAKPSKTSGQYPEFGYYGQYPLSYAAVFSHTDIYDYLIKRGADTDAQDMYGNTVLHIIVLYNQIEMFSYAMRHPWKKANPWIKNKDNLTPLALCCKLGFPDMFNAIIELSRVQVWTYSDLECSLYPLVSFDTIGVDGSTDKQSAIMILINGESVGHLEMMQHPVVKNTLQEKWRVFVKKRFLGRLILYIMHLICMSSAIYLRKPGNTTHLHFDSSDTGRYFCEMCILIGMLFTLSYHRVELRTSGFIGFVRNWRNVPAKGFLMIHAILIVSVLPLRIAMWAIPQTRQRQLTVLLNVEEYIWIIAALTGFPVLMMFMKVHHRFGPLIITLYTMIARDITKVMIIYCIFWVMFATVFLLLFKDSEVDYMQTAGSSMMAVYHMSFGAFEHKHLEQSKYAVLTEIFFFLTMLFMPILLLNMLIASMANTYTLVEQRSKLEWFAQYASTVITLERAYKEKDLAMFQKKYTVEMNKHTVDSRYTEGQQEYLRNRSANEIIPALKLTMKMKNTKAFIKRRATNNWKWLYGVIRELIKAKREDIKDRPITFYDLFLHESIEAEYLRDKKMAEALRKVSLDLLFKRSRDHANIISLTDDLIRAYLPRQTSINTGL